MKILFAHMYDSRYALGGAERVVINLATAMKDDYGHDVTCAVNSSPVAGELRERGCNVVELAWSKWESFQTITRLGHVLQTFQPAVVHSHHRYTTFLLDLFFRRRSRILHTEHVLRDDKKSFFRYGHYATAVAESVRQQLIDHYRVPEDRVCVIPNAVQLKAPNMARVESLRRQYMNDPERLMALCVGRLEEQKGQAYLVEAVSMLSQKHRRKIVIFFAGDGRHEEELKSNVKHCGLSDNFAFLGFTKDISELLELCAFLVLPSLREGLPLTLLEAYAGGRPVIATDIPGTRDIVDVGNTGILVPARDPAALARAIESLLDDPIKTAAMAVNARRYADRYSYKEMTAQYDRLYRSI
ncbi:MAG: glycosyltransferase family 4 protein [Candidatus Omnitrophota bacterium]|nr:glycosyltransferase family 4 protein [Candidatus Omnitrophota bacterium]